MTRTRGVPVGLLAAALAAAVCAGCGSSSNTTSTSTKTGTTSSGGTLQIPFIGADSGSLQELGVSQQHGARLAIDQINAAGGLLGKKLAPVFRDDAGNPPQTISQARALIAQLSPPVLFGSSASSNSEAIEPLTTQAKIIQFPGSADAAAVNPQKYPYVFRAYLTEISGDVSLASYMQTHHLTRAAVLVSNTAYGLSALSDLKKRLPGDHLTLAGSATFTDGLGDFTPIALQVKRMNPDVIYMVGSATSDFSNFAKAAQNIGEKAPFIGNAAVVTPTYKQLAGAAGANTLGQVYASQTYTSSGAVSKALVQFTKAIDAIGGKSDLLVVDMYWYDMVKLWAAAVQKAGSTSPAAVKTALESITGYQGIQGTFSFSPSQHDGLSNNALVTAQVGISPNAQGLWKQAGS